MVLITMDVISTALIAFLFSGIVLGEEIPRNETECPPTIVDCACTEKDGNFYTIQINMTTVNVSDEETGVDRCVADGDPLALCEDRDCVIIPNDNFATLFRKGRKMTPSNYLQEDDLVIGNGTSSDFSNNTDQMAGPELWDELTAPFYPIELTYPRMIHGEDSHQLVKRSEDELDSFIPPPEDSFGSKKYRQKDNDSLRSPSGRDMKNRKKGPRPLSLSSDYDFDDEKYRKKNNDSLEDSSDSEYEDQKYRKKDNDSLKNPSDSDYEDHKHRKKGTGSIRRRPSDSDYEDEEYGRKDYDSLRDLSDSDYDYQKYRNKNNDSLRDPLDSDYEGQKYRRKDTGSFRRRPSDSDFEDEKYSRNDTDSLGRPSDLDFGNIRYGKKGRGHFRPQSSSDFGDEKHDQDPENDFNISLSDSNESPPELAHQEEPDNNLSEDSPSFRGRPVNSGQNVYSAPTYWGGNYGYACKVPQLKNSEVTCWKWPNWQSCKQTCIYGHGIGSRRGTLRSTTYTCRNTENRWLPYRMTDCQPYLNCKVRLRTPGDLKCVEPTDRPAYCDIACEEYDNYSAKRVRVVCDEKQRGMRLPFCAFLDNTGANYVRSPY